MFTNEELPMVAVVALLASGYDVTKIDKCAIRWCEPGQHLHITARMKPELPEKIEIIFTTALPIEEDEE